MLREWDGERMIYAKLIKNKYKKIIALFKKHKIYEIAIGPEVFGFLYKSFAVLIA